MLGLRHTHNMYYKITGNAPAYVMECIKTTDGEMASDAVKTGNIIGR